MSILNFNEWSILENEEGSYIDGILDMDIIAATIIGEAGGESDDGMNAIKNVLDNRATKRGSSAAGESLRPKQFSMWNSATKGVSTKDDFDSSKLQTIIDKYTNHAKWNYARRIARVSSPDATKGATLYYSTKKYKDLDLPEDDPRNYITVNGEKKEKRDPPYWALTWTPTVVIGNHKFGKSA